MSNEGRKDDRGKPRWSLMPWTALNEVVLVLDHGAKKYGDHNWRQVDSWRDRYFSAAMRHLVAWYEGDVMDAESGCHHLAHATCCLLFLMSKESESDD